MAGPKDFTGQNIQDTYQRVLQTDGVNIFDGTGSAFNLTNAVSITSSHAQQAVTASHALFAISASHEITHELSTSYSQTADSASGDFHIANNLYLEGTVGQILQGGAVMFTLQSTGTILPAYNMRTSDGKGIKFGNDSDYTIQHNSSAAGDTKLAIREGNTTRYTYGIGGHITASSDVNILLQGTGEFRGESANITSITASNISSSGYVLTSELRGGGDEVSLNVLGNITASANISASGAIIGDSINVLSDSATTGYKLYQPGPAGTLQLSDASGGGFTKFYVKSTTTEVLGLEVVGNATIGPAPALGQPSTGTVTINSIINNNVTASGDISASGTITANAFVGDGTNITGVTAEWDGTHNGDAQITGSLVLSGSGHITASGNISVSGTGSFLSADISSTINSTGTTSQAALRVAGGLSVAKKINAKHLVVSQDFAVGNNVILCDNIVDSIMMIGTVITDINQTGDLNQTGNIFTSGHISASGDISSSGVLYVNHISTGSGELSENYISITGSTSVIGHITASGNISSSHDSKITAGTGSFRRLHLGDTAVGTLTADLHIRNAGSVNVNLDSFDQNGNQIINFLNNQEPDFSIGNYFNDGGFQVRSDNKTFLTIGANDGDEIEASGSLNVTSHISASGNITATDLSASGVVYTNHISTGSGELAENYISITGSTSVFGNITASGNISVGGNVNLSNNKAFTIDNTSGTPMNIANINGSNLLTFGDNARIAHLDGTVISLDSGGSIFLDSDSGDIQFQDNAVTSITLNSTDGHISASGNITATDLSASGVVYTNHISTGSGELAENYISITGSTSVFGNITASANISASGHIITHTLRGNTSGDQSGSLTLGGSLTFNENVAEPAVSASTLFAKRSGSNNATDSDLRFSNFGLTPSFGFFSMDGDGTDDSNENPFGKGGGSVTSTTHNMIHTFDDGSEGVRAYIQLDGIYKIHGTLICESSTVITNAEISLRKDGSDVFATTLAVHSSVDPVERSFLGVTTADSGSYFDVTLGTPASSGNLNMKAGSTFMVERLA